MNIEFHYYTLNYLCRSAGFTEAEATTIALSSQLTDEATSPWRIGEGRFSSLTEVTQNYSFWSESVRRDIYLPFHFIPGEAEFATASRQDKVKSPLLVTSDSPASREILLSALRSRDLYRIGIAFHAYADTWAHQNFSGALDPVNALDTSSPLPAIGHLQALRKPDDPGLLWVDPRLIPGESEVDNAGRFLAAAKKIYRFLRTYLRVEFSDEDFVLDRLERIWRSPRSRGDAVARAADYVVELSVPPYEHGLWSRLAGARSQGAESLLPAGYDGLAWIGAAQGRGDGSGGIARGTLQISAYDGSAFERWNRAARAHREVCRAVFSERGF
jgi:hypothetical protein